MKNLVVVLFFSVALSYNVNGQFVNIGGPEGVHKPLCKFKEGRIYVGSSASIHYSDDEGESWRLVKGSQNLGYITGFDVEGSNIAVTAMSSVGTFGGKVRVFHTNDFGNDWKEIFSTYFYDSFSSGNLVDLFNDTLVVGGSYELFVFNKNQLIKSIEAVSFDININLFHDDNYHYYKNLNDVVRTKNYKEFEIIHTDCLALFRNNNSIFIQDNSNSVYRIDKDSLSLMENDVLEVGDNYFYSRDTIYVFKDRNFTLYNQDLKEIGEATIGMNSNIISENLSLNNGKLYYQEYSSGDLFVKNVFSSGLVKKNITNNLRSTMYSFININNQLWVKDFDLSYFNPISNTWVDLDFPIPDRQYFGIINDNEFIKEINFKYRVISAQHQIIRDIYIPENYLQFGNTNDIVFGCIGPNDVYYSRDKGVFWLKLNFSETVGECGGSYSNNNYIIHNRRNEMFFSKDKINWTNFKFDFGFNRIDDVEISDDGSFYILSDNYVYKYQPNGNNWLQLPGPSGVNFDSTDNLSSIAIYKNVLIISVYGYGIYISFNDGETWEKFDDGIPNKFIADLTIIGDDLYASTNCHVYKRPLDQIKVATHDVSNQDQIPLELFPVPVGDVLNFKLGVKDGKCKYSIYKPDGSKVISNYDISSESIFVGTLKSGIYIFELNSMGRKYHSKFIKI